MTTPTIEISIESWIDGPANTSNPVCRNCGKPATCEPTLIAFQRFYSIAGLWKRLQPEEFFYQQRFPLAEIEKQYGDRFGYDM